MATLDRVLALMSTAFWLGLAQTKGIELILGLIDKSRASGGLGASVRFLRCTFFRRSKR